MKSESNLAAALGSFIHFQMAPQLKARDRLHPLACLLASSRCWQSFFSTWQNSCPSAQLFCIGGLILDREFHFCSTVLKWCWDNKQSVPFQIWHEVLQNFHADSSGTAIHLSYSQLEKLFIIQQIQLISILYYFLKDLTPDFNLFLKFSFCSIS